MTGLPAEMPAAELSDLHISIDVVLLNYGNRERRYRTLRAGS